MKRQKNHSYPEEMLLACRKGKPCSYGICDECPNTLGIYRGKEDDQERNDNEEIHKP